MNDDFSVPSFPTFPSTEFPSFGNGIPDVSNEEKPYQSKLAPPIKQPKVEPKPKEAETLGFITNLPKSILNITKGVFIDLPKSVAETAYHYATGEEGQYAKDFNLMLRNNSGLGSLLWHEMSDYYTKDFWANFNEDPGRFLQDAATLASGVGGAAKLSGLPRIASVASKAGEWLDPLTGTAKLAGKALAKPLEAIGFGELTPDLEKIARTRAAREALDSAIETKKQLFDGLKPEEGEELRRLLLLGDTQETAAAMQRQDEVGRRFRNWKDRIGLTEEPFLKEKQHLIDDDKMIKAKAKGVQIYTSEPEWLEKHGLPIHADQAEQMIRDGILDPTFLSMYRLKNQSLDLFDALNEFGQGRRGTLGRLENRLGRGEYLKDVDEIMARQIHSFHNAKYKLNLLDEVKEMLLERGKLLIAKSPEDIEKAISLGYRRLDDAFYQKYWESFNRATAIQTEAIQRARVTGANTATELLRAKDAFQQLEKAGKVERMLDKAEVYVPAHVAAWLNRELAPISKGWQMYDKWMSRFKSTVTVFNPRYWTSVIFGNALMATMYGLSPDIARVAWNMRGDMPIALKQLAQHEIMLRDLNIFDRLARRWGDAANILDQMGKQGIYVSELAKVATKNFYTSLDEVSRAVKAFSQAPEMLSKTRAEIAALRNTVAVNLEARDAAMRTLRQQEKRLTHELAKLMELRQTNAEELSIAIAAREERLGKAFGFVDAYNNRTKKLREVVEKYEKRIKEFPAKQERWMNLNAEEMRLINLSNDTESGLVVLPPLHTTEEVIKGYLYEIDQVKKLRHAEGFDPNVDIESLKRGLSRATEAWRAESVNNKYSYFVQSFNDEMKHLKTMLKNQPHLVDNAGVVAAIDSAIRSVESGKPELLRYSVKQLKKAVNGQTPAKMRESRLSVFLDMIGKTEARVKTATAETLQKLSTITALQEKVPGLRELASVADRAIDTANRYFGSWYSLLPFERQILRRVVPFYTFTKAMTKLAFQFPFINPKRTFIISHLTRAWNDIMHDENSFMPSWSKNYIPVGAFADGNVMMMRIGSFTPLANVRMGQMGTHDLPSIADIASQHPLIRVAMDLKGGIPEWTKRPLSPGDSAVRLDNGEVVEWTGTGFRTTIAQPGVWKSIFGMFPQSQLIHALLSQYAQTDRGWLFNPDPIVTPSGKPRYPKELSDILLTYTLAPTTTVQPSDLAMKERVYVATVAKEFQREIRTASPERRASLISALQAWSSMRREAAER